MEKSLFVFLVIILFILSWNCEDKVNNDVELKRSNNKEKLIINAGNREKELKFSFNKVDKPIEERTWKKSQIISELKMGGIENESLLYPSRVKTDENGNIYILDWAESSVKEYDKSGKFLKKYGKKGKGPGEFTKAFDFDVIKGGGIVMLGPNENKFVVFDGTNLVEFKSTLSPIECCFVSPDEVATFQIMDPITKTPFQKVNYKKKTTTDYQNFLDKESFSGEDFGMLPFLIGDIHRYKSNYLVYISSIMGYVVLYTSDCKIDKVFKLIDDVHESGLNRRSNRVNGKDLIRFPRKEEYLFRSSNIFGNNLYIFCDQVTNKPDEFAVDIYSLPESKYKYSLLLKGIGKITSMFVTDEKMYVVKENTEVEVFDYKIRN